MREVWEQFRYWREHSKNDLVLATITATEGSAYRKAGATKLLDRTENRSFGILSGGCLEAELHREVLEASDFPFTRKYDTGALEERFFGYQKGCRGQIEILFERVRDLPTEHHFFSPAPPQELLIIGVNEAIRPLGEIATAMGWLVHLADSKADRLEYFLAPWIQSKTHLRNTIPAELLNSRLAIVAMTHNFEMDLELLRNLTALRFGYLGIVGSKSRFEQLQRDLKEIHGMELSAELQTRIFSPAGTRLPGHTPEAIALSIVHQVQDIMGRA